jgi:hypothetical protein
VRPAYRTVYDFLETAIYAGVPKAEQLEDRIASLFEMKPESKNPS